MALKAVSDYKSLTPVNKSAFLKQIKQKVLPNLAAWHISETDYAVFSTWCDTLTKKTELWKSPHTCTSEVRTDLHRYEAQTDALVMNWLRSFIMNNPYITPAERIGMDLPPDPYKKRTARPALELPVVARIQSKEGGRIRFRLFQSETSGRPGKPDGVIACELYYGEGENLPFEQCSRHELYTRSCFILTFDRKVWNHPHTVYFRWVSQKGEYGPWGVAYGFVPIQ
ncbi:hypothetical protein Barb4_00928 [Bacteroidales bacterium Barb4]|nr:hypothetical protein Barb4_00928 [Bacteroidales bacterium Barb4]